MGMIENKLDEHLTTLARTFEFEGERTRLAMAAALAETVRGQRIDGAQARALRAGPVYVGGGRLVGWSARETGGTAAVSVDVYDGAESAATADPARLLASFTIPAGGSAPPVAVMPAGVSFTDGLYVVLTGAGVVLGSLWRGVID